VQIGGYSRYSWPSPNASPTVAIAPASAKAKRREQRAVAPQDAQRGTPVVSRGTTQLKVGLRVRDLESSCALYLRLGFKQIPRPDEPRLRYLTFGHTWLILSDSCP
jgi:hypothetical protein